MAPDRFLMGGAHPARRAAYVMIMLAVTVIGLAIWNINLNGRVGTQEAIRRVETRAALARAAAECRTRIQGTKQANLLLAALRDLASIPQKNLQTYLDGPLTADQRAAYKDALMRYQLAEKRFHGFPIPECEPKP